MLYLYRNTNGQLVWSSMPLDQKTINEKGLVFVSRIFESLQELIVRNYKMVVL